MKRGTKGFLKERFIMNIKLTEEQQVNLIVNTVNIGIPVLLALNVGLYVNDYLQRKKENDRRIKEREEVLERFDEVLKKV